MGDTRATDSLLRGIDTAKSGNKLLARLHLLQAVELAPRDPNCWLWLAWVAESPASAIHSLQRVLDEHPNHELAQLGLKWASAMAEYEYEEFDPSEKSPATTTDGNTDEESRLAEDSAKTQAADDETSETETWEVATEEDEPDDSDCNVEPSASQNDGDLKEQEVIAESSDEAKEGDAETLSDEPEPMQVEQGVIAQDEQFEAQENASSVDWFTQDETVSADAFHEEMRFAVEDNCHDENFGTAENFESGSEAECQIEAETPVDSEVAGSYEWPTKEQANEETVIAEVESLTEQVEESNPKEEPIRSFRENIERAQSTEVDREEPFREEVNQSPAIQEEGHSANAALATAALAELEMSSPEAADDTSPAVLEETLEQQLPVQPPKDANEGVSVLVVDDSPTVRKLVTMTLEKNGFTVGAAADGVVALKCIAELKPRLILLDITMPRLGGYQLCKLIKKHESTKHIPVIMLSGKDGMFDKVRGKFVGCDDYITKPFDPEVLVEKVSTQLTEHYGVAGTKS